MNPLLKHFLTSLCNTKSLSFSAFHHNNTYFRLVFGDVTFNLTYFLFILWNIFVKFILYFFIYFLNFESFGQFFSVCCCIAGVRRFISGANHRGSGQFTQSTNLVSEFGLEVPNIETFFRSCSMLSFSTENLEFSDWFLLTLVCRVWTTMMQ